MRLSDNVTALQKAITTATNPFMYEEDDLINMMTNAVLPCEVQEDIGDRDEKGQCAYLTFVQRRITTNAENLWSRMHKLNLKMWKYSRRAVKNMLFSQVIELKDDRSLFARLVIIARMRPEVNLAEAIGNYEFNALPRALFSPDGMLLPCTVKSKLMSTLEALVADQGTELQHPAGLPRVRVAVLDGMSILQSVGIPKNVTICKELSERFIGYIETILDGYQEGHIIFDRYDIPGSMKTATRQRRLARTKPIVFHVKDATVITNLSMKHNRICSSSDRSKMLR